MVADTRSQQVPRDRDGWFINSHQPGALHYRIATKANFARMWRVAHAFFVECERRSYMVRTASSGRGRCRGGVIVTIDELTAEITFFEKGRRGPRRETPWGSTGTIVGTGLLQLVAGHSPASGGTVLASNGESRWRLEDRLDRAMHRLERLAIEHAEWAAAALERQRQRQVEQARRDYEHAQRELHQRRLDHLIQMVDNHGLATRIPTSSLPRREPEPQTPPSASG